MQICLTSDLARLKYELFKAAPSSSFFFIFCFKTLSKFYFHFIFVLNSQSERNKTKSFLILFFYSFMNYCDILMAPMQYFDLWPGQMSFGLSEPRRCFYSRLWARYLCLEWTCKQQNGKSQGMTLRNFLVPERFFFQILKQFYTQKKII